MFYQKSAVILLASIVLCSVNQVFTLRCYTCESLPTGSCKNPSSGSAVTCPVYPALNKLEALLSIPTVVQSVISEVNLNFKNDLTDNLNENDAIATDCGTIYGNYSSGQSSVVRSCLLQQISCEIYAQVLWEQIRFKVTACIRCNKDLCNTH